MFSKRSIVTKFAAFLLAFALPVFGATQIDLTTQVKGVLPIANGGSGSGGGAPAGSTGNIQTNGGSGAFAAYAGGSCTNQFFTAISASGAITCTSPTLAGAQFANQGTATTVLHGNAAGNPSFASVALGDIAQSGANTMLGNWSGSTANVAANAMPSCSDTGGNHLNYVSGTGVTCGTTTGVGGVTFTSGTSRTLSTAAEIIVCTSTCTITPPGTLTAGYQFCVQNDDNVATVITLAAVTAIQYEATARTSYGTANHTKTSGGAVGDQICMVAVSTTKYNVFSSTGTWTNN